MPAAAPIHRRLGRRPSSLSGGSRASPRALAYARGLGTAAALYSIFLAFLSALVIEAFCLFCVGLHVVNFGIAGVGWYRPPARPRFLETLGADLGREIGIQQPMLRIHRGAGSFDSRQGVDQLPRDPLLSDGEILEGALGLSSPERIGVHFDGTEAVAFDSDGAGGHRLAVSTLGQRPDHPRSGWSSALVGSQHQPNHQQGSAQADHHVNPVGIGGPEHR